MKKANVSNVMVFAVIFGVFIFAGAGICQAATQTIAAGKCHTVALKTDGTLWAWGENMYGQLGDGTTTDRHFPVQIGFDTDWAEIAAGYGHTIALKTDGTLWAWGDNINGQLGNATTIEEHSPVPIGTDTDWAEIAAGGYHSIALKTDGSLWAWGANTYGELGNGSTIPRHFPVLSIATNCSQVDAGASHTVLLRTDGRLWVWGCNSYGQIGDGTTIDQHSPVLIGSSTDWAQIAAGLFHTIARMNDGSLLSWGCNTFGGLGNGNTVDQHSPVLIGTGTDLAQIAAGGYHSIALNSDGTLWAWGCNSSGQLGDGTTTHQSLAKQIGSDTNWSQIAAGSSHTIALKTDGTLWAWGYNECGQVGDGSTVNRLSPVEIPIEHHYLYYPHVASNIGNWETEICVINTSAIQTITGFFTAYNNAGHFVSEIDGVTLTPHARREIIVGEEFVSPSDIGYIIFQSDSDAGVGYTKFYIPGKYRVAVPATPESEINAGDIYISHIASGGVTCPWATSISLLNTTPMIKELSIEFDNGTTKTVNLPGNEHKAFTIRSLFAGAAQPAIKSAVIKKETSGIIGLELFASNDRNWMSGILLKDDTTQNIYYPHTASGNGWATGIVAYNPSVSLCNLTITPYSSDGVALPPATEDIGGEGKYIGTVSALGLPAETAWLHIEASNAITGFELFSRLNQLGGYTGVGISGTERVFPKIEKDGGTGIAFVNIEETAASILLTAYDDSGAVITTEAINLDAHEKVANIPENIFTNDIGTATYIAYSSDKNVVGSQLNTSSDFMMLDGLPGM